MNRSSPSKRRKVATKRHNELQSEWQNKDLISSYDVLKSSIVEHLRVIQATTNVKLCEDHVVVYNLNKVDDKEHSAHISLTIRILQDMSIRVFVHSERLPDGDLKWALTHTNGLLQFWSQLDNIITRYSGCVPEQLGRDTRIYMIAESIENISSDTDDPMTHTLLFLADQLRLVFAKPKGRRYTTDMIIRAFTWYQKSSYNYLSNKVQYLKPSELLVILQLDEIHIKPKLTYKCGKLIGNAGNNAQHQANRIQCFMISSVLSSNKDVVSLVPVQKMTTHDLTVMTQEVIQNVTRAGYRIVSVISDNNVVNRKMFMELSGTGRLVPYIQNPINVDERIYILFDTVHLLKCIRNNWINDVEKSFTFPDFSDNTVILNAVFSDLINIYHMEKESILKDGYKLTWKSLFPNNIDRQNVKLALKVFDRTTIAALEVLGPHTSKLQHWEGTAQFISIVLKFWNIVNVKNTTKGLHKLLEDATVISSIKDDRLNWLDRFSSWLKLWNTKTEKQGHLSK